VEYSHSLWVVLSGDRIPEEARFSAPVQTGPGARQSPVQWVPSHCRGVKAWIVTLTTHPL